MQCGSQSRQPVIDALANGDHPRAEMRRAAKFLEMSERKELGWGASRIARSVQGALAN